jgi:hypothetical protein
MPELFVFDWLKSLESRLWRACAPDRFGRICYVPSDLPMDIPEFEALMELIEEEQMVTTMTSGTFGLGGYGVHASFHPEVPGLPPVHGILFNSDQLPIEFGESGSRKGGAYYDWVWELFSKFTHSEQNRRWLEMYKMDPPYGREHYDY